jgi:hypothetical protein
LFLAYQISPSKAAPLLNVISLESLRLGQPAISPAFGSFLAEACQVCLQAWGHQPGAVLSVKARPNQAFEVIWEAFYSDQMARSWHDQQEATEYGATAVAILLVAHMTDYTVIRRSVKGTGFDYWLGDRQAAQENLPFQATARLEISGIFHGQEPLIRRRVKDKLQQVQRSDHLGLPALVIVTEFSSLRSYVEQYDGQ